MSGAFQQTSRRLTPAVVALSYPSVMGTQQLQPNSVPFEATAKGQIAFNTQDGAALCPESALSDSCVVSPDDDEKRKETQRQAWFENAIKKKLNIPNSYLQVAPLIIRWDPEIDDYDEGHTSEVSIKQGTMARFCPSPLRGFSRRRSFKC